MIFPEIEGRQTTPLLLSVALHPCQYYCSIFILQSNCHMSLLDEFYKERNGRVMSVKHHNLLKKNISYFTQNNTLAQTDTPYDTPLQQTDKSTGQNHSLYSSTLAKSVPVSYLGHTINSQQTELSQYQGRNRQNNACDQEEGKRELIRNQYEEGNHCREYRKSMPLRQNNKIINIGQYLQINKRHEKIKEQEDQSKEEEKSILKRKYAYKIELQEQQEVMEEPISPSFNKRNEIEEYIKQITSLQQQNQALKKQNLKQKKFIQSLYKMKKTLTQQDNCSMKELWRWVKQLAK